MKFFISHKKEDEGITRKIYLNLMLKGIKSYLDLLDIQITSKGKQLTDHIRVNISDCTDIIVIMSEKKQVLPMGSFIFSLGNLSTVVNDLYLS